jgi:hypothetical protein
MSSGVRVRKGMVKVPDQIDDDDIIDRRSEDLRQFAVEDTISIDALKDVFAGTDLVEDKEKVRFVLELRGEVRRHWGAARDSFLAIGRALVAAEWRLSKLEYERLRAGMDRLFPFGDAVASQLRKVARAVDDKRIPEDSCPGSYATAYQIAVLKPHELQMAMDRGLIREDVTRKEIVLFRNEIKQNSARANWNPTETERDRLRAREQVLVEELENVRRRLKEIDDEVERS